MSIRIVLADDHVILRHGLSKAIGQEEGMEVIAQAENGQTAVDLARELNPDIIVMDIGMPDLNGIEATRQIKHQNPNVKIIALSMHSNKKFIIEMFKAGASGYLLKDCEFDELAEAIKVVHTGKTYLSPSITDVVVENYVLNNEQTAETAFTVLSEREREVLQLLAEGKTTKQVARALFISPKTVEGHRSRVMKKLNMDSIAKLTKYAIQEGLTLPEP